MQRDVLTSPWGNVHSRAFLYTHVGMVPLPGVALTRPQPTPRIGPGFWFETFQAVARFGFSKQNPH